MNIIRADRIVPVVVIDRAEDAVPLARVLSENGLNNMEITLRTEAGLEAIRRVAAETDLCIGAGTVLSIAQADAAAAAGAQFLVSPGTNPAVVGHCVEQGIPILPGVCSPTDIELACSFGLETLKFFPAEAAGGVSFLKAMSAPYAKVTFVPTGGITAANFLSYAALPSVVACGASWMVERQLIANGNWEEIGRRCREVRQVITENNL